MYSTALSAHRSELSTLAKTEHWDRMHENFLYQEVASSEVHGNWERVHSYRGTWWLCMITDGQAAFGQLTTYVCRITHASEEDRSYCVLSLNFAHRNDVPF